MTATFSRSSVGAALVCTAFFSFSCATSVQRPLAAVRPDLGIRKQVELRVGAAADALAHKAKAPVRLARAALDRAALTPVRAAVASGNPIRATYPTDPGPTTSPGPSNPCSGGGGSHGGGGSGGFLEGFLLSLLFSLVFGLFIWGSRALWRSIFPPAPELPNRHAASRVLALVRLAPDAEMERVGTDLGAGPGLTLDEAYPLRSTDDGLLIFSHPDPAADLPAIVATLAADDRVLLAQLDYEFDTTDGMDETENYDALVYGPALIGADRLQERTDGTGIRVAVIDTGIDGGHPDYGKRVVEQIDATGAGLSADLHGTALAGVIAAAPGDGFGVSGVAPGVELLGIKACQPESSSTLAAVCWSSTLAKGIDFAIRREAQVVNLSVAGPEEALVTRMVNAALRRGSVVVAAAGNGGADGPVFHPGALEGVLTVTAIDADEKLWRDASRGDQVDLAAPGVEILSDAPDGSFPALSGTSFATAHVAGAVA
ncbi:MAG: S8 family serine peptidase, partial [Myxococcales bacterium]|nr:S8 family serine peptidase [Myxococcales bacterium]